MSLWALFYLVIVILTGFFSIKSGEIAYQKMSLILFIGWLCFNIIHSFDSILPLSVTIDFFMAFYVFYRCRVEMLSTHLYFCTLSAIMILLHSLNWLLGFNWYYYYLSLNILFMAQCIIISYHSYIKSKVMENFRDGKSRKRSDVPSLEDDFGRLERNQENKRYSVN